jgi:hypothetical protein
MVAGPASVRERRTDDGGAECWDEQVLCAIEAHDATDSNITPAAGECNNGPALVLTQPLPERPKTAGRVGSGSSSRSGGAAGDNQDLSSWQYTASDCKVDGPSERLPPQVLVSESGEVRACARLSPQLAVTDGEHGRDAGWV